MGWGELKLLEYKPFSFSESFAEKQMKINDEKKKVVSNIDQILSPVQMCSMPHIDSQKDSPKNKKNEPCNFSSGMIDIKTYSPYNLPNDAPDVLKIISGFNENATEVKCSISGLNSPCEQHKTKVFDIAFKQDLIAGAADNQIKFKARSIPFYKIFENGILFPWDAKTAQYKIVANTCGQKAIKEIIVYPDVKIELEVPFEFSKIKEKSKKYSQTGKSVWNKEQSSKELKITASYKEDGHEWKVSADINRKFEELKALIRLGEQVRSVIQKAFDESIKIETILPSGKLHLDFCFAKVESYNVDSEWNALIQLSPLIGGNLTIALDEIALKAMTGPVGAVYSNIKKYLENHNVEIKFEFCATGEIGLDCGLKKKAGSKPIQSGAGLTGKIEFQLRGAGNYQFQKIIRAEGAAEAGVKCDIKGSSFLYSANNKLNLETKVEFSGVVFYCELRITGEITRKGKTGFSISKEYVFGAPKEALLEKTFTW